MSNEFNNSTVKEMNIEKYNMPNESDRLKEYEKLKEYVEQLKRENIRLSENNSRLQNELQEKQKKVINYDRIINRHSLCKDRLMFSTIFLQLCGQHSCLYGSTVRKCFECLFHPTKFKSDNSIGDTINSDINILFYYQQNVDKVEATNKFLDFLNCLETTRIMSEKPNSGIEPPIFNGYKLTGINNNSIYDNNSEPIPKAQLFFIKGTDNVRINMICWRYKEIVDFSVNNFIINSNGIQALFEYNFLQYLENIYFQETKFIHRPDILQSHAFPPNNILNRHEKLYYLNKVYELTKRSLNLLPSDYKIAKLNPIHSIETKEDCSITGCSPPYPLVLLQCGHKLSLMAYKGILFKTSDIDTQAIRCPLCRQDLKLLFHMCPENTLKYKLLPIHDLHKQIANNDIIVDNKFISKEAMESL